MREHSEQTGMLIVIVGPSGSGKDTLLNEIRKVSDLTNSLHFVKRTITRNLVKDAEDFWPLSTEEFVEAKKSNAFCVAWEAHGLHYGVPQTVLDLVKTGHKVVLNGARRALPELQNTFKKMAIINISADPDVLAMRLMKRGREDAVDIWDRLKQQNLCVDPSFQTINIDNSGSLERSTNDLHKALKKLIEVQTQESLAG